MAIREAKQPSFRFGRYDGYEEMVIPASFPRGGWLALLGLSLWPLPFLLKGGIAMLVTSRGAGLHVFLVLWIVPVALCMILQTAWWLGGTERISIIGGDLLLRHTIFGLPIATWSFRGDAIRLLAPTPVRGVGWRTGPVLPFLSSHAGGSLKFFYRERTVYLAEALDDAEAQSVVDWLAKDLPAAASERVT